MYLDKLDVSIIPNSWFITSCPTVMLHDMVLNSHHYKTFVWNQTHMQNLIFGIHSAKCTIKEGFRGSIWFLNTLKKLTFFPLKHILLEEH